jgi:hypothetical protein
MKAWIVRNGISRDGKMPKTLKNWCPDCKSYQNTQHVHIDDILKMSEAELLARIMARQILRKAAREIVSSLSCSANSCLALGALLDANAYLSNQDPYKWYGWHTIQLATLS